MTKISSASPDSDMLDAFSVDVTCWTRPSISAVTDTDPGGLVTVNSARSGSSSSLGQRLEGVQFGSPVFSALDGRRVVVQRIKGRLLTVAATAGEIQSAEIVAVVVVPGQVHYGVPF